MVICGPSGVGKDSVIHELKKQRSDLHFVVTATTRWALLIDLSKQRLEGMEFVFLVSVI